MTIFHKLLASAARGPLLAAVVLFPAQVLAQGAPTPAPVDPAALIEALKSKSTRGVKAGSPAELEAAKKSDDLIATLKAKATRGLSVTDRRQLAEVTSDRPAVDLEISFGYNSDKITDETRTLAMALGKTLTSDSLKGQSFMIAGHTDAKGRAAYNQALSERRAQAVKDFLLANFDLKDEQLMVVGYGMEKLKDKSKPYSDINRRVEVVNISPSVAMSKN